MQWMWKLVFFCGFSKVAENCMLEKMCEDKPEKHSNLSGGSITQSCSQMDS